MQSSPIIDFHAHAFPDALAGHAIRTLEAETDAVKARLSGRIDALIHSMDQAGIVASLICSIATRPKQFQPILDWSCRIASDRIIPLASVHPEDPERFAHIAAVKAAGLIGIKLHPYYQRFVLDDPAIIDLLKCARDQELMVVCHTGYDVAFPRERLANPARVARVIESVEGLCFIATHLGAWEDWQDADRILGDLPLYRETSFALGWMPDDEARALIDSIPDGYLMFGTDSPWADQSAEVRKFKALGLPPARERAMLYHNADRLLSARKNGITPPSGPQATGR